MMPDQLLLILKVMHTILVLLQQDLVWLEDRSQVWMPDQGSTIHSLTLKTLLVYIMMLMMMMMMMIMMMVIMMMVIMMMVMMMVMMMDDK
jgi:hypothetical protein